MDLSTYRKKQHQKIPNSVSQLLTDEIILLGLLKEIYNHHDQDVEKVEVKLLSPFSDITGNLSDRGRLCVLASTHGGVEHQYNWFVKVQPIKSHNADLISKFNLFRNEIKFYSKIAPELKTFVETSNTTNEKI